MCRLHPSQLIDRPFCGVAIDDGVMVWAKQNPVVVGVELGSCECSISARAVGPFRYEVRFLQVFADGAIRKGAFPARAVAKSLAVSNRHCHFDPYLPQSTLRQAHLLLRVVAIGGFLFARPP